MDFNYKLEMLGAITIVVVTVCKIAKYFIFHIQPSLFSLILLAFAWALIVTNNQFWKDTWTKK